MSRILAYIILCTPLLTTGQGLVFDQHVHDFGIIKTDGGAVSYEFGFVNSSESNIEFVSIQTSCGCTVASLSDKEFKRNQDGSLTVEYDPKGRPGWFMKSVKVLQSNGEDTLISYVSVKGIAVVDKDDILAGQGEEIHYDIKIKPFEGQPISEFDTSYLNTQRFNTFVNEITYIIDEQNFVELKIHVDLNIGSDFQPEDMVSIVQRNIINALKARNYSPNSVGFSVDTKKRLESEEHAASIKVEAVGFSAPGLEESIIRKVRTGRAIIEESKKLEGLDTLFIEPFVLELYREHGYRARLDPESKQFDRFITRVVRSTLTEGHSDIGFRAVLFEPEGSRRKAVKKYEKHLDKMQKEVENRLEDEGLAGESFAFLPHQIQAYPLPKSSIDHDTVNFVQVTRYYVPPVQVQDTNEVQWDTTYREVNDLPYQNLPVYVEGMNRADSDIDTVAPGFLRMMRQVERQLNAGHDVVFMVESSSSQMPSRIEGDPAYRAEQRGDRAIARIENWLEDRGYSKGQYRFLPLVDIVKGPEYNTRIHRESTYRKFEYIKVIPTFKTVYHPSRSDALIPYRINFETDIKELPTETILFQNFITKMAEVITKQGYVRLIIESSSSRIPSTLYRSNSQLSFYRAESAEENIREELRKRGVDPRKLIVVEQRVLVQGPAYNPTLNRSIYKDYQYVKIIPEAIIRE